MVRTRRQPPAGTRHDRDGGAPGKTRPLLDGEIQGTDGAHSSPHVSAGGRPVRAVHSAVVEKAEASLPLRSGETREKTGTVRAKGARKGETLPPEELIQKVESQRRVVVRDFTAWKKSELGAIPFAILSGGKVTDMSTHPPTRYISPREAPWTLRDLVAPWLDSMRSGRTIGTSAHLKYLSYQVPTYFVGGEVRGKFAYVDIVKCFYSLYRPMSYDMSFNPKTLSIMDGTMSLAGATFLEGDAVARNSVIGIARRHTMTFTKYGERGVARNVCFPLTAPCLWAFIAHTLSAIAQQAIHYHEAIYVATDGFILPERNAQTFKEYLYTSWNLNSRIEGRGDSRVWGLGRYSVGEYRSQAALKPNATISGRLEKVLPVTYEASKQLAAIRRRYARQLARA